MGAAALTGWQFLIVFGSGLAGAIGSIVLLAWWVNVGSARRHWRQAEEQARADFAALGRPVPPRQGPPH